MKNILHTPTPVSEGWDHIDIKAALERRGWSLSRLSAANGYSRFAAVKALRESWPQVEWIIAEALDLKPWDIWPERYPLGPTDRPARRPIARYRKNRTDGSTGKAACMTP
ncbi:MAG: helix-turn-helix domain-containing protein [Magnetococcales bacterium]|nr:helix-turn-helix domain-containing protein [Magnetococcales bacterium]